MFCGVAALREGGGLPTLFDLATSAEGMLKNVAYLAINDVCLHDAEAKAAVSEWSNSLYEEAKLGVGPDEEAIGGSEEQQGVPPTKEASVGDEAPDSTPSPKPPADSHEECQPC